MKIIQDQEEVSKYIRNKLFDFYKNRKLIPFLGAGFTKGENSKKGEVPDGEQTRLKMIKLICFHQPEIPIEKLEIENFQKISSYFYRFVPKENITKFLSDNFLNINLSKEKKNIISLSWPNIYTLNIDDAIERNSTFKKILPYRELNRDVLMDRVFKMHGDAEHEITYLDDPNIIFSTEQYIKSLHKNSSILSCFHEDYVNKNFLFIGCSLQNELDLMYIIEKPEVRTNSNNVDRVYVTTSELDFLKKTELENFGINTILIINDYTKFYDEVYIELSKVEFEEYSIFDEYKNIEVFFDKNLDFNKKFLVSTQTIAVKSKQLTLPIYFAERTILHKIISSYTNNNINIIVGRRISGKTFLAIDIARRIQNRNAYLFLSNISVSKTDINLLLSLPNILIIFDTGSIGYDEIKLISDAKERLEQNKSYIIMLFNSSDRLLLSIPNTIIDCQIYNIENKFDEDETELINDRLSSIGLPKIISKKTLLDNIFISKENFVNKLDYELHQISNSLTEKDIKVLILSASFDKVYSSVYRHLGISTEDLQQTFNKIGRGALIEFDYTEDIEAFQHSSFKTIVNSKVYIFRLLGRYIDGGNRNVKRVADYTVEIFSRLLTDSRFASFNRSLILFDNLNQIFLKKEGGVINLIFLIYEKLEAILYKENNYWIQRAKSILHLKQNNENLLNNAITYAKKAYHDSSDYSNIQLQASFLIAMLYGRLANLTNFNNQLYVSESIIWYYSALQESSYNRKHIADFLDRAKRERSKNDFYSLCTNLENENIDGTNKKKLNFLINKLFNFK